MAIVKLFGAFAEMAGWRERTIEVSSLSALRAAVAEAHPDLPGRLDEAATLVILNGAILPVSLRGDDRPLDQDDEVAFGPPVSGG
jgi:molybdopterin synthase sulfur carrier subunit